MPSSISQHQRFVTENAVADRAARRAGEAGRPDRADASTPEAEAEGGERKGMSFWDVLDVINPLQHIPVVNRIYRAVTGDEIGTPARLAGSALLFGPVGMAIAAADSVLEHQTGKDAMGHALAMFRDDDAEPPATAVAENKSAPQPAPQADPQPTRLADAAALRQALEQRQAAELVEGPGASAARAALAGLPPMAAVGTLPAPGSGLDANTLAALSDQGGKAEPQQGKGLNQYRQLAGGMLPPAAVKPYVPPMAVQAALNEREKPGAAGVVSRLTNPALVAEAAQRAAADAVTTDIPNTETPAENPRTEASDRQNAQSWPPGGPAALPPALIADMMALAMDKYEAQAKSRQQAQQPSAVNGRF